MPKLTEFIIMYNLEKEKLNINDKSTGNVYRALPGNIFLKNGFDNKTVKRVFVMDSLLSLDIE